MKLISDKIAIRKSGKDYEIFITRSYIDRWGKPYQKRETWDIYFSKERALSSINKQRQSMRNCGYLV